MRKTHEDRINLINRLERKYAMKVQLHRQERRQSLKSALRSMRGRQFDLQDRAVESIDGMFYQNIRTA